MKILSISLLLMFVIPLHFASASPYQDLADTLKPLGEAFHQQYGLASYKKALFSWDVDAQINQILSEAKRDPALDQTRARMWVNQLFTSTRDFHAQAILGGQPVLALPIGLHSANRRVFVTAVLDPNTASEVKPGDELLIYDGEPVWKVIESLTHSPVNQARTDLRDAERRLTSRYGSLLDPLPTVSLITLAFRHSSGESYQQDFVWKAMVSASAKQAVWTSPLPLSGLMDADPFTYLSRKSYFPRIEHLLWEAKDSDFFYAWTGVQKNGQRIGMIRISGFALGSKEQYAQAIAEFKTLIARMNGQTDALILDLQGNRGGLADYVYALASFFFNQPVSTPQFSYRLSLPLVESAKSTVAKLALIKTQADAEAYFGANQYGGYPVSLGFIAHLKGFYEGLVSDAQSGLQMSKNRYYDIPEIQPYPGSVAYLKPLFLLTDEWSASASELFASIFQDTKRAKIIGNATAGAGAFVGSPVVIPNPLGFSNFRIPIAIAYRIDGSRIENRPILPDFKISPDSFDLSTARFEHYGSSIENEIQSAVAMGKSSR